MNLLNRVLLLLGGLVVICAVATRTPASTVKTGVSATTEVCATLPGAAPASAPKSQVGDHVENQVPRTHISIMPARYIDLQRTVTGYRNSGIPLVRQESGLWQAPPPDDVGIYYFVPKLVSLTGWPLQRCIDVFLIGLLLVGFVASLAGWCFLFDSVLARTAAGAIVVILTAPAYLAGDVYIAGFSATSVVPWALYTWRRPSARFAGFLCVLLGILAGTDNYIRSYSGTAVILLAVIVFTCSTALSRRRKQVLVSCLLVGMAIPWLFVNQTVERRDAFLSRECPQFGRAMVGAHPFWHSVYIGLGFLQNDPGRLSFVNEIRYRDEAAFDKVEEIKPNTPFFSREYNRVLKAEILKIAIQHPVFFLATFAAKAGVILFVIIICGNVGFIAAYLYRKPWHIDAAFWLAIMFSALPGLLVVPSGRYLLGLISLVASYSIESLGYAIECRRARRPISRTSNIDEVSCGQIAQVRSAAIET